ncbi:MAG: hypothetical protein NVV74_12850 [Magnetospirillum sp.]|nr:hypothetical protein [Magnetospirillum sp.]
MNGRPQVLVAVGSDTLALRMRLMLEAEGAEPVVMAGPLPAEVRAVLAVAAPAASDRVRQVAPGVPIIEVADGEDWDGLRRRLAEALGHGQASPPPSEAEALAAALQRARILLVDDSVTYREFLRHELARLGAVVTVCPDPAKAVAHLEQGGGTAY